MADQLRGLIATAIRDGVFERDNASLIVLIQPALGT